MLEKSVLLHNEYISIKSVIKSFIFSLDKGLFATLHGYNASNASLYACISGMPIKASTFSLISDIFASNATSILRIFACNAPPPAFLNRGTHAPSSISHPVVSSHPRPSSVSLSPLQCCPFKESINNS